MIRNIQRFFLLAIGLLFCIVGCARDRASVLMPDHVSPPIEVHDTAAIAMASFEQNLLPILTARCAFSGCHVADGPHGLDFRTYESFIAGGEHGPAFIPGNAQESKIVEQLASGSMPPSGPPLTDVEIQLFVEWINQQEIQVDAVEHVHSDEHIIDKLMDEDMDDDHDEEHDEDMDDAHEDDHDDDDHDDDDYDDD